MPERIPFRNRAHEVSRIEAFSDVVFGFAISLLVVSLEQAMLAAAVAA